MILLLLYSVTHKNIRKKYMHVLLVHIYPPLERFSESLVAEDICILYKNIIYSLLKYYATQQKAITRFWSKILFTKKNRNIVFLVSREKYFILEFSSNRMDNIQ